VHISYILIPLVAILVAFLGGRLTMRSVVTWYRTIRKPLWTPPGSVIGLVWTVLYILAAVSALIVWNLPGGVSVPVVILVLFILNAIVNVAWSYVFFSLHRPGPAIGVSLFLDLTIMLLIWYIAPLSVLAAWLLVPYVAWVSFATYLNYRVWAMNQ
jgi:tryptophan-rich sensory protein